MARRVLMTASTWSHLRHFHLPYLRRFQAEGWEVHAACGGEPEPLDGVDRYLPLPFEKRMASPRNFRAASILRKVIRQGDYSLIITHTALAAFFTRLAVLRMRERPAVVCVVHGYLFDDSTPAAKRAVLVAAERLTAPVTDLLLTMNRWDCEFARRNRLGRRVEYIPGMGVDFQALESQQGDGEALRREYGIPEGAFVLLYPAEFSRRKNQETLLRALALLPERAVLVLAGSGRELGACKALAEELGLSGRVFFPGQLVEMAPWYRLADAAVTASRSEGLPFNVMEAMDMGLAVVASAVKGHTDLIVHNENGLLYEYSDAEDCARQIRALMSSAELRRRLGGCAREQVQKYGLDTVFPQVWGMYLQEERAPVGV